MKIILKKGVVTDECNSNCKEIIKDLMKETIENAKFLSKAVDYMSLDEAEEIFEGLKDGAWEIEKTRRGIITG